MKYIIILLIIAIGFLGYEVYKPELIYYPEGDMGSKIPYFTEHSGLWTCYICGETATVYKVDSRDRIICNLCYQKIKNR